MTSSSSSSSSASSSSSQPRSDPAPSPHPSGPSGTGAQAEAAHNAELAARITLLHLPKVGPARLRWLLSGGDARSVVADLCGGRLPAHLPRAPMGVTSTLVERWVAAARTVDVGSILATERVDGTTVLGPASPGWPFHHDPEPPLVLFAQGDLQQLATDRQRVAIVGTRRCTGVGRQVAHDLGAELAASGVGVVSGLASGIDTAAHVGALEAGGHPIAVIATGLDVAYPAANSPLLAEVRRTGLVLTESKRGTRPERWRFPARNRLIASIVGAVVVVESHAEGGSLHTVDEAIERGCPVLAVPGAVTSSASAGTNQLLVDGAPPVRAAADVLDAIGWAPSLAVPAVSGPPSASGGGGGRGVDVTGAEESDLAAWVLREVRAGPVHLDTLATEAAEPVAAVVACIQALAERDLVEIDGGSVSLRQQPPR
ncbi:MAG: DNA-processing protein DprA [Actinomycetota bacterium]